MTKPRYSLENIGLEILPDVSTEQLFRSLAKIVQEQNILVTFVLITERPRITSPPVLPPLENEAPKSN